MAPKSQPPGLSSRDAKIAKKQRELDALLREKVEEEKRKAEAEAVRRAEEERLKAEDEKKQEEAKRKAEEERRKLEEAAKEQEKQRAQAAKRKNLQEKRKILEEKRKLVEEAKKRAEQRRGTQAGGNMVGEGNAGKGKGKEKAVEDMEKVVQDVIVCDPQHRPSDSAPLKGPKRHREYDEEVVGPSKKARKKDDGHQSTEEEGRGLTAQAELLLQELVKLQAEEAQERRVERQEMARFRQSVVAALSQLTARMDALSNK